MLKFARLCAGRCWKHVPVCECARLHAGKSSLACLNGLDRARMRQANRIFELGDRALTKVDLVTLVPDDILQSRLFATAQ